MMSPLFALPIVVRGGGDLASGVAYRLIQAGFPVIVTELAKPLFVRPRVSYGAAIYEGSITLDGIEARCVSIDQLMAERTVWFTVDRLIPVVVDPAGDLLRSLQPPIVIDARMAKINLDTLITDAPLVIALGPGFSAGVDCHAVIETNRGHTLGRVIWQGSAEPDTATPGKVNGRDVERVLRAPRDGYVTRQAAIGSVIRAGETIAWVDETPLIAPFDGLLRGLIHELVFVTAGLKVGDLDPRAQPEHSFTISDKSLSVGGGVVEAVLSAPKIRELIRSLT